jgi:hypothetical protein
VSSATVQHTLEIDAPVDAVWDYATNWQKHGEWMPLTTVETLDGDSRHVGGRLRAWSGIGPLGFTDPMTVTSWERDPDGGGRTKLVHTGRVVRGDAEVVVVPVTASRTKLVWIENLQLGRVSRIGFVVAKPVIELVLAKALSHLARNVVSRSR